MYLVSCILILSFLIHQITLHAHSTETVLVAKPESTRRESMLGEHRPEWTASPVVWTFAFAC